jgi:hypothetical protein
VGMKIILILFTLSFTACTITTSNANEEDVVIKKINSYYKIITIDSCEYVFYETHHAASGSITHKGNCKHCAIKKEL